MIQHFAQHIQVMRPDAPGQRRLQFRKLGPQAAFGQVSQRFRVIHTSQQRRQHGLRRLAPPFADHRSQLQVGVLQDLVQPIAGGVALTGQTCAITRQIPQVALRLFREEAALQRPVLYQLGDPIGFAHVGLAPRRLRQMAGVDDPHLAGCHRHVVDRLPVDPRAFHGHVCGAQTDQPGRQRQQVGQHRAKPASLDAQTTLRIQRRTVTVTNFLYTSRPAQHRNRTSISNLLRRLGVPYCLDTDCPTCLSAKDDTSRGRLRCADLTP